MYLHVNRVNCINFTFETIFRMNHILLLRMFRTHILLVVAISSLAFISCRDGGASQNSNQAPRTTTNNSPNTTVQGSQNPSATTANPAATTANTGAAGSEFHYICANNCEGSGANAAGNCPVCGEELVHNTSFHAGDQGGANSSPQIIGADDNSFSSKITPLGDPGSSAQTTAAPAATGGTGFHYTCSAGCGGGGDAQGSCPNCGQALVHNAAYHAGGAPTLTPGASPQARPTTTANKYPSVFNTPGAVPQANVNTVGASHYICSAGCGGGGNAQGSCPKCGAALVHNDAFH